MLLTKIKKKVIIDNSNKLLNKFWDNNDINKDKIEIYRQFINHSIIILSLEELYILKNITKDNFIILDIGCGVMSWENEIINIDKNNKTYDFYIFCIDKHNFFKNINRNDFGGIKKIVDEVKIIFEIYDVINEGLKHENETIDYVFQRDMISVYKFYQWEYIINEIYHVLKNNCYAEIIEYDINIKNEVNEKKTITEIYNKTLIDIFKINGQETDILKIYEKIKLIFGEKNVNIFKKRLPLYYEDNLKGLMARNMILGYSYFEKPLSETLNLKGYEFNESLKFLKEEWELNKAYMELYVIIAKKIKFT